jgi:hypothetical protein
MFSSSKTMRFTVLSILMLGFASLACAQATNSGAQSIALNATLAESLTLSLSGNAVNFTLASGSATNVGSTDVTATTSWVLKPGRTAVTVDAYFASATAALTDGGAPANNIPSSAFQISNNSGPATALTSTVAFGAANAGLRLENVAITGANKQSSVTDDMVFNINLSSLGQLPAGTYTGTLNIQAQATP